MAKGVDVPAAVVIDEIIRVYVARCLFARIAMVTNAQRAAVALALDDGVYLVGECGVAVRVAVFHHEAFVIILCHVRGAALFHRQELVARGNSGIEVFLLGEGGDGHVQLFAGEKCRGEPEFASYHDAAAAPFLRIDGNARGAQNVQVAIDGADGKFKACGDRSRRRLFVTDQVYGHRKKFVEHIFLPRQSASAFDFDKIMIT